MKGLIATVIILGLMLPYTIYETGTSQILKGIRFYQDEKRMDLLSSVAEPADANIIDLLESVTDSEWSDESVIEKYAVKNTSIIEDCRVHLYEDYTYTDCVLALGNSSCESQSVYVEFKNANNQFRVWKMNTVERKDWADFMHNNNYINGGAGVYIIHDDLPIGDYYARLFREKNGKITYSGKEWYIEIN